MSSDIDFIGPKKGDDTTNSSAPLFVSLYVVVLAFFIMLTSKAQFDVEKQRNVMESVNKAFSKELETDTIDQATVGSEITIANFFEDIKVTVASIIPLYEVDIITDGRLMKLTMPISALYYPHDTALRPDRKAFFERLTGSLNQWKPNAVIQMEYLHGIDRPKGRSEKSDAHLEVTRLGHFARYLENNGVDPANIAIGINANEPDDLIFTFKVVEMGTQAKLQQTIGDDNGGAE